MTLDIALGREGPAPRDAATLVLVRDGEPGLLVFCVERHPKSGFLGGAVVFPGGKVDPKDFDPAWVALSTAPRPAAFAESDAQLRAFAVTACRETLEEAAMLPLAGGDASHEDLLRLRARILAKETTLADFLRERRLLLDLAALHPLARWVTPAAEARRYDARFFLAAVRSDQRGAHDEHETTKSFWASPADVLDRFRAGSVMLAPPTHRILERLGAARTADEALALTLRACLDPICPRLVRQVDERGDTLALVLPGDPEHEIGVARVAGSSRYVLRDGRFLPEDAPPALQRPSR